jgi:protein-tyrosine phosphatase
MGEAMRSVLFEQLWVGNREEVANFAALADLGITAIVDLAAGERPLSPPRDWIYCRIPLADGEGNSVDSIRLAVNVVASLIGARVKTLVACSMGMSRSLAIAAAAVARTLQQAPEDCLVRVAGDGPADVSPTLWRDVLSACFDSSSCK